MANMDSRNGKEVTRVKIGKYEIPEMRLYPTLVEAAKKLYETFELNEASDELTVAKLLGHATNKSGAFLHKISYMRTYGLLEKRGLKVTPVVKRLTYDPDEEERNKALREILLNLPLWKELYSKYGKSLPSSNLWVELTKIAGLEAPTAQKVEEIVRKAYLDDFQYLKEEKKPTVDESDLDTKDKVDTSTAKPPEGLEQLTLGSNIKVWLPKGDQEAAKKAIQLIKLYSGIKEKD
jgi:hypothetical protein